MPRRLIPWLGLCLSVLLACCWLASYRYQVNLQLGNSNSIYGINSGAGALLFERLGVSRAKQTPWRFEASADRLPDSHILANLLPRIYSGPLTPGTTRMSYLDILIPYWIPLLLTAAPTAFLIRRHRRAALRARTDFCPHCSYRLTGLPPNSPCPECGRAPRAPRT